MEWQHAFNIAVPCLGVLVMLVYNKLNEDIKENKVDHKNMYNELHTEFIRREEFNSAIGRIEATCNKILDKLDQKVDK